MTRLDDLRNDDACARWVARTEGPLLLLGLAFLAVFLVPLYRPDLPAAVLLATSVVSVLVWVVFSLDYAVRLLLSPDRAGFVRSHPTDLLVLLVPLLRPLRLLRLVGLFSVTARRAGRRSQVRTTGGVVVAVALLVVVCGGLVLDAERGQEGANITTAQDALWWGATTVTTVGYGDRFPTTGEGRLAGVLLMLGGIALLGVLTASIAAWFVRRFTAVDQALEHAVEVEADATAALLAEVLVRLERVEALLQPAGRQS